MHDELLFNINISQQPQPPPPLQGVSYIVETTDNGSKELDDNLYGDVAYPSIFVDHLIDIR